MEVGKLDIFLTWTARDFSAHLLAGFALAVAGISVVLL